MATATANPIGDHNHVNLDMTGNPLSSQDGHDFLNDQSSVNPIPVYGRGPQKSTLLTCFHASQQSRQVVFISGSAGSGKSALTVWLENEAVKRGGVVLRGKHTINQTSEPYAAFAQICRQVCRQLTPQNLSEMNGGNHQEESKQDWDLWPDHRTVTDELATRLGGGMNVLARWIPDFSLLFSHLQDVKLISSVSSGVLPAEERVQFHRALRLFFSTLSELKRLVLVVDDLQWADHDSVALWQFLIKDQSGSGQMIVGCHRDGAGPQDRVSVLRNTADEAARTDARLTVTSIRLFELDVAAVHEILCETIDVGAAEAKARELAEIVHQNTKGNALFAVQFIRSLREENLLGHDKLSQEHTCEISKVALPAAVPSSIIELMQSKIDRFPPQLKILTQLLTCFGAKIAVDLFQNVLDDFNAEPGNYSGHVDSTLPKYSLGSFLNIVVRAGFIRCLDPPQSKKQTVFGWVHDKIQEAASFKSPYKEKVHGQLGELLLKELDSHGLERHLFTVVSLLNDGSDLISPNDTPRLLILAELNLRAGRMSMAASALVSATGFFSKGLSVLPADHWKQNRKLSLDLHALAAEAHYYVGNLKQSEMLCRKLVDNPYVKLEEKRTVYFILTEGLNGRSCPEEAVSISTSLLEELGCNLASNCHIPIIIGGILRFQAAAKRGLRDKLDSLPVVTDENQKWQTEVLFDLTKYVFFANRRTMWAVIVLKLFRQALSHGKTPNFPVVLSLVSILCTTSGLVKAGRAYCDEALREITDGIATRHLVLAHSNCFMLVYHWTGEIQHCIDHLMAGHKAGIAAGIVEGSCWMKHHAICDHYFIGTHLSRIRKLANEDELETRELGMARQNHHSKCLQQVVANLTGSDKNPVLLEGTWFDLSVFEGETMYPLDTASLQAHRIYLAYLFDEYDLVFSTRVTMEEQEIEKLCPRLCLNRITNLSVAMAATSKYRQTRKRKFKRLATNIYKKIKGWVDDGDPNSVHHMYLVKAELLDVKNKPFEAKEYFQKAIALASDRGHLQDQAMGHQRLAELHSRRGDAPALFNYHMLKSASLFARWGARAKVSSLEEKYTSLFQSKEQHPLTWSSL